MDRARSSGRAGTPALVVAWAVQEVESLEVGTRQWHLRSQLAEAPARARDRRRHHDTDVANQPRKRSIRAFERDQAPQDVPEIEVSLDSDVYVPGNPGLHELGLVLGREGRRMIDQGGVKLDGPLWSSREDGRAHMR